MVDELFDGTVQSDGVHIGDGKNVPTKDIEAPELGNHIRPYRAL